MSLHLKYIIFFIWEHNTADIKDITILNQICAFFLNEHFSRINLLTSWKHFWKRNHFHLPTILTNARLNYY